MNEKEKSLALAKLMGWDVTKDGYAFLFDSGIQPVSPYDTGAFGLSQFAAIILKFPEVFSAKLHDTSKWDWDDPTQENVLNEILRLNGVDV